MENVKLPHKTFTIHFPGKDKILQSFPITENMSTVLKTAANLLLFDKDKYNLRFGNHVLDLRTDLRFSNLPEGALLDVVRCEADDNPSNLVPVRLALAREDIVVDGKFRLSDSLWCIVEQLMPPHTYYTEDTICVRYIQKNFVGKKELMATKLSHFEVKGRMDFICDRCFDPSLLSLKSSTKKKRSSLKSNKNGERISQSSSPGNSFSSGPTQSLMEDDDRGSNDSEVITIISDTEKESNYGTSSSLTSSMIASTNSAPALLPEVVYLSERYGKIYHMKHTDVVLSKEYELIKRKRDKKHKNRGGRKWSSLHHSDSEDEIDLSVVLRICFPNKYIIQARFLPNETIEHVTKFLKRHLSDPEEHFYLCTMLPKLIMTPDRFVKDINSESRGMIYYAPFAKKKEGESDYVRSDLISPLVGSKVKIFVSWNKSATNLFECTTLREKPKPKNRVVTLEDVTRDIACE